MFCAHIRKTADGGAERQSVEAHCRGTADIAAACLPETLRGIGELAVCCMTWANAQPHFRNTSKRRLPEKTCAAEA